MCDNQPGERHGGAVASPIRWEFVVSVASLALDGAMFVSPAPPADPNTILHFCYFLLLVQ
jgi:hypothetical protein